MLFPARRFPLLLICFFLAFSAYAQEPANTRGVIVTAQPVPDSLKGNVYAIITGISSYPGIPPLKYADKDALLFRDFLKTPNGGNTKPENILMLINDSAKAADFNVRAYRWLQSKKLKKDDRLYIYFSGHGDAMNEDNYFFLPFDCTPNKDDNNYLGTGNINLHTVKTLFIKPQVAKGVEVLLVMDACRTNELPGGTDGQQTLVKSFIAEEKMGDIILLSTGAGQVSVESPTIGNGHGLFTYYLIDGLAGAADKDSLNGDNDGRVSLSEIGAYVKSVVKRVARTDYNTVQIPYYCCPEKDLVTIAKVDNQTFTAWEKAKQVREMTGDQNLFASNMIRPGTRAVGNLLNNDTSQINLFNRFIDAVKSDDLKELENAERLYQELERSWPGSSITEDAKYSLASKYLNFCQQKINLFLGGKGLIHIINMEKDIKKDMKDSEKSGISDLDDQIKKLKTLVTTGFDVAAKMMEKVAVMLKDEPELLNPLLPKLYFLQTMGAYSEKSRHLSTVLQYCRKAIESDPGSASGYLLMGWIYQDMQDDSCAYYFRKAASLAPKWAYPMNGLGNYYFTRNNKKAALDYFFKAIELDKFSGSAYRNIGVTYLNKNVIDSAKMYFWKAVEIDQCDSYANEYYGTANAEYISQDFGSSNRDSTYFRIARKFYLRSIACDANFASGYQKLSALYSRAKNEDSAFIILQNCISINPENAEGYRNLGNYVLKTRKDTVLAERYFSRAITLDPSTPDNYFSLARLYRKQGNRNKAVQVYNDALENIGVNKDLYNELGNTYFEAPSDFEKAISYYHKALSMDSTMPYVYFNLGKLYGIKYEVKDSSIYFYERAVLYDPERFKKISHTIADYYFDKKMMDKAKSYYVHALSGVSTTRHWDVERLVNIYIEEKNYTEAENAINKYMDPDADKDHYKKLMIAVIEASGK